MLPMNPTWYKDAALLRAAKEEYGSLQAAATAIGGVSPSTLQKSWNRLGLGELSPGPTPRPPANAEALRRIYDRAFNSH